MKNKKILIPVVSILVIGVVIFFCIKTALVKKEELREQEKWESISNASVGDSVHFGNYNGKELEWKVLAKEGNKLLIFTKDAVAKKPYNDDKEDNTWEKCTLRKWLNNEFFSSAFDSTEQSRIELANVVADKNPEYTTDPGNATQDKIFLLSINEVNKYFISDSDRMNSGDMDFWWLRSPGSSTESVAMVGPFGSVFYDGLIVDSARLDVRPALWINLES